MNNPTPTPAPAIRTSTTSARPDPEQRADPKPKWHMNDRRKQRRFSVARPGKVFRRATQQFNPVHSLDLSFSGALLEVDTPRPFAVGEIIDLGLAMGKESVVPSSCMVQAVVVRVTPIDPTRQTVAIRYVNSVASKLAA